MTASPMRHGAIPRLAVVLGSTVVLAGCTVTHVAKVPQPPADAAVRLAGGGTVSVTARSLRTGTQRVQVADARMEFDEQQYATAVAQGLVEELGRQGYEVSPSGGARLDLTVVYVVLLPAVMRHTCYVDFAVAAGDDYYRGHQAQGLSGNPKKACDAALANVIAATLSDPGVREVLSRDRDPAP